MQKENMLKTIKNKGFTGPEASQKRLQDSNYIFL